MTLALRPVHAVYDASPPPPRAPAGAGLIAQFWRRRHVFGIVFAATIAATLVALAVLPVRYIAVGSIIVAEQEAASGNASAAWAQKIGDPADLESQLLIIRSPRMLRLALARPGVADAALRECEYMRGHSRLSLSAGPACTRLVAGSQPLLEWAEPRFAVAAVGRSRVINVSYTSQLPEVSQAMADALLTSFLDDQRAASAQSREEAAQWLWQEVAQLDDSLKADEAQIQRYRRENGLVRGQFALINSERLSSVSNALSAAQALQAEAAARRAELGPGGTAAGDLRGATDSRAVADIKMQLATVVAQIENASQTQGPLNPYLRALRRQQAGLEERLRGETTSIAASARRSYEAATRQVAALTRELDTIKRAVSQAADSEATITSMMRAVEIKRSQYETLYKRASELETERRVLTGSTRLVSLAELPTQPFFPKRTPFLAAGLTLATILGTAAALLKDLADNRVRSSSGVEVLTDAPVLVQIPFVHGPRLRLPPRLQQLGGTLSHSLDRVRPHAIPLITGPSVTGQRLRETLALAHESPLVQDALRSLHAQLVLAGMGGPRRKLLVTSAEPQEGKTFTVLALADLVAGGGRSVLVIEADMRRPSFAPALGLPAGPGLTDILRGTVAIGDAVVQGGRGRADVIPAGRPAADATDLLLGPRLGELLAWAEQYDLVLIDSPPSEVLMDARVLAPQVDGILCCVRWGTTLLADASTAVYSLRRAGGVVLGLVVTAVDIIEQRLYDARPVRSTTYMLHE